MLSIGLLVHAQHLTGSFAAAGVVTGAYAVALGVGGPLLGRLVDRRGQTAVLLAQRRRGAPRCSAPSPRCRPARRSRSLVALAAGVGLATPPVGACMRTLLPGLLADAGAARAAYAVDASAVELTWIAGPPLVLGLGALWSTGAALAAAGVVLLARRRPRSPLQPASRAWRPAPAVRRGRAAARCSTPAMRTLVVVLLAVGVLFGAVEVGVAAAADAAGGTAAAGAAARALGRRLARSAACSRRASAAARRRPPAWRSCSARWPPGHLALVPAPASLARARRRAVRRRRRDRADLRRPSTRWSTTPRPPAPSPRRSRGSPPPSRSAPRPARPPPAGSPTTRARRRRFALAGAAGALALVVTLLRRGHAARTRGARRPQPSLNGSSVS